MLDGELWMVDGDGELMFAVLDVAEVFYRPRIVLPKEHSLDAVLQLFIFAHAR